jgi:hypothetical protein
VENSPFFIYPQGKHYFRNNYPQLIDKYPGLSTAYPQSRQKKASCMVSMTLNEIFYIPVFN